MLLKEIESIVKSFGWDIFLRIYGNFHPSIIGLLSADWLRRSRDNCVLDGAPSPIIGNGRHQKNADLILCEGRRPSIVVEAENNVIHYFNKLDSLFDYLDNNPRFEGIDFGLMVLGNYKTGPGKYQHNWDDLKEKISGTGHSIALVSIQRTRETLDNTVLGKLRRNDYGPWAITSIDYWIHSKDGLVEGNVIEVIHK